MQRYKRFMNKKKLKIQRFSEKRKKANRPLLYRYSTPEKYYTHALHSDNVENLKSSKFN